MIKKQFLLFLFLPVGLTGPAGSPVIPAGDTVLHMEQDILYYVNLDRKAHHLKPLELNETESAIALEHSRNMASGKVPFGHQGLTDRAKRISKSVGPVSAAGENVASGEMSAKEVVDGWLNSPGHKRNIEGDFTLTGIGCVRNKKGTIYFTQIFTR